MSSASGRKWDEDELMLPGFRFRPTDEELVDFYLRRKVENKQLSIELIKQVDIYKYEPWELPTTSVGIDDQEWYFFCLRGRKYRNSLRPNRVTGSGFWKATGIDKPIYSFKVPYDCIGLKKSLVYYRGSAGKGSKTDWMMHEFRLPPMRNSSGQHNSFSRTNNNTLETEVWTLCRIFKRITSQRKYIPAQPQPQPQSLHELKFSISSTLANSNSKTCSDESKSNHSNDRHKKSELYLSIDDQKLIGQQNYFTTQLSSLTSNSASSSFDLRETRSEPLNVSGFWNASGDVMLSAGEEEGDWDELRPVVDPYGVVDLSRSR